MSANSSIEWCDHTFNPWIGCTKVSPGCVNCYAEATDDRRYSRTLDGGTKEQPVSHWGKGAPRHRTSAANWKLPLRWNKSGNVCGECGSSVHGDRCFVGQCRGQTHRPRVFCSSLADWLDDEVPIEWVADLLALIHATPNLDWLLLTKRPENWRERISAASRCLDNRAEIHVASWLNWWTDTGGMAIAPDNVWIGTSVEDQTRADERIPLLLEIPATVRFLSCEPLLGPVDLTRVAPYILCGDESNPGYTNAFNACSYHPLTCRHPAPPRSDDAINWVICGGESGPKARPMHPDWARSLRDQCSAAGVPFLFKQWGEWLPVSDDPGDKVISRFYKPNRVARGFEDQSRIDECYGRRCTIDHHVLHADGSQHGVVEEGAFLQGTSAMTVFRVGKKAAGRLLDGREWNEFPAPALQEVG